MLRVLGTMVLLAFAGRIVIGGEPPTESKPVYANDLQKTPPGKLPDEFMKINGEFEIKEDGGNRCIELPGDPQPEPDSPLFSVLFGPTESAGFSVSAKVKAEARGRGAKPHFYVGTNGVDGFLLKVDGKGKLELHSNGAEKQLFASADFAWTPGTWTRLKLQVRKVKDGEWALEGKAWKDGDAEPAAWAVSHKLDKEPENGRFWAGGIPYNRLPMQFDDLEVAPAK